MPRIFPPPNGASSPLASSTLQPIRVLLLDDHQDNLFLRTTILRQQGYHCIPTSSIEEATEHLNHIDIAVLDYHLGSGQFGTEVAELLRRRRPHVPIIILSATLEHFNGGVEDMHLLKGYSSAEDLLNALSSFEAKRGSSSVVVDARDFYYSRIALAIGSDALVQVFDEHGTWQYCNDAAAGYLQQAPVWFIGRNIHQEMQGTMRDWRKIIHTVCLNGETYIDRTHRGLFNAPRPDEENLIWSVIVFPITLHDNRSGAVLTARVLERTTAPGTNSFNA